MDSLGEDGNIIYFLLPRVLASVLFSLWRFRNTVENKGKLYLGTDTTTQIRKKIETVDSDADCRLIH